MGHETNKGPPPPPRPCLGASACGVDAEVQGLGLNPSRISDNTITGTLTQTLIIAPESRNAQTDLGVNVNIGALIVRIRLMYKGFP